MKFGAIPVAEALGATAVHSIRQGDLVLKKGTKIGPAEIAALTAAGVKEITVARLDRGDVSEDKAAADIAAAIRDEGVRAGGSPGRERPRAVRRDVAVTNDDGRRTRGAGRRRGRSGNADCTTGDEACPCAYCDQATRPILQSFAK